MDELDANTIMRRVLDAAIRSPSGDNCQPWRFEVMAPDCVKIFTVKERARSFFDYGGRGTLISVGALIENMRIQAAADGYAAEVAYHSEGAHEALKAEVRLHQDDNVKIPASHVEAMLRRTVNRRPFLPLRLSQQKLDAVLADPVEGVKVTVIDRRREIRHWARLIYLADRIRYSHPVIHEELFAKILFTKEMAEEQRLGLEIDRLGAGPAANPIMRFLQPWDRIQHLQRYGIDIVLANQSRFLGLMTGVLVLITVAEDTPHNWIIAGEEVERLWVAAEEQGLCVHPMTVALFLNQRYQEEGMDGFLPGHQPILEEIRSELDRLLAGRTGTMLFRMGTGWRMKNTAVRMPLESFMSSTIQIPG